VGEQVPVVGLPAELVDHGGEGHAGVGHASRDHDVGAHGEGLGHCRGAQVDVGAEDRVADVAQGLARVHVGQGLAAPDQPVQVGEDVVAEHDADLDRVGDPQFFSQGLEGRLAGERVHAARVADHLDPLLHARGEHVAHLVEEVGGEALLRALEALLLEDRHGDLGEVVHDEVVDGPALDLALGGGGVVSPESAAVGDNELVLAAHGASLGGAHSRRFSWRGAPKCVESAAREIPMNKLLSVASVLLAASVALASPESSLSAVGKLAPVKKTDFCTLKYKGLVGKRKKTLKAYVKLAPAASFYFDSAAPLAALTKGETVWLYGEPVERESQDENGRTQVDRQIVNTAAVAFGDGLGLEADEGAKGARWLEAEVVREATHGLLVRYQGSDYRVVLLRGHAVLRRQGLEEAPALKKKKLALVEAAPSTERPDQAKEDEQVFEATRVIFLERRLQKSVYPLLLR
jgi:hypothetical protein